MRNVSKFVTKALTALSVGLFVILVGLKLAGLIGWSWWWVCSPVLIPLVVSILLTCIALAIINNVENEE